jgi:hypothetical protein
MGQRPEYQESNKKGYYTDETQAVEVFVFQMIEDRTYNEVNKNDKDKEEDASPYK